MTMNERTSSVQGKLVHAWLGERRLPEMPTRVMGPGRHLTSGIDVHSEYFAITTHGQDLIVIHPKMRS